MHTSVSSEELRLFDGFLDHLRQKGRKEPTLKSYRSAHRELMRWTSIRNQSAIGLLGLTGIDAREWRSEMLKRGAAPTTINHRIIFLKGYARWAAASGKLPIHQLESIRSVPEIEVAKLGAKALEPDAFRRFMRNVELTATTRDRALVYLLLCGLRESEAAGLRGEDITLTVNKGSLRIAGDHVKGSSSRVVPLPRQARIHLRSYVGEQINSGPVFSGERGHLTVDGIYKLVRNLGEQVGLRVYPHLLRHQFSLSYLAENQGDLVGLQALLGHASIDTTAKHYARKRYSDLAAGVEKIVI